MQLATANLFLAQWTDKIHEEWIRNLLASRPALDRAAIDRTRNLMNRAVDDPLATGYEHLIQSVTLPAFISRLTTFRASCRHAPQAHRCSPACPVWASRARA